MGETPGQMRDTRKQAGQGGAPRLRRPRHSSPAATYTAPHASSDVPATALLHGTTQSTRLSLGAFQQTGPRWKNSMLASCFSAAAG